MLRSTRGGELLDTGLFLTERNAKDAAPEPDVDIFEGEAYSSFMKALIALLLVHFAVFPFAASAAATLPSMADIRSLYPDLSDADFRKKLNGASDRFHFLRTLVPAYYLFLQRNPPQGWDELWSQSGWCVGDAHPENFGILLSDSGNPLFTMNDIDDAGLCPLVADALRFFVAVRLYDRNLNLHDLYVEYQNGVRGAPIQYSRELKEMAKKAEGKVDPSGGWLSDGQHLKRGAIGDDVSGPEWGVLQFTIATEYGANTKMWDAVRFQKDSGGSGGMLRYRVLIEASQLQVVELKQIQAPGIFPLARGPIPPPAERIARTLRLEQGAYVSDLFRVTQVGGYAMYLRPRRKGNLGIDLASLSRERQVKPVLKDEAKVLGQLHLRGALDIRAYQNALSRISEDEWMAMVDALAGGMGDLFDQSKKPF